MSKWLVFDTPYLCYRAFHAMGNLTHEGVDSTVVFGVLRDVQGCQDLFPDHGLVFCFDRGRNRRLELCSEYKANRAFDPKKELDRALQSTSIRKQIDNLRLNYLPELGVNNVVWQDGYEADDLIASIVQRSVGSEFIVVAADSDLWQLLGRKVSIWNPRKSFLYTENHFRDDWGISPSQWADVKAMAGCSGDNVIGIRGIGEKTAARFLAGVLGLNTRAYQKIVVGNDIWKRNLPLVRLPFDGVKTVELLSNDLDDRRWFRFCRRLGLSSLIR